MQDFTAIFSSTAVSSFVEKHIVSIRRVDRACHLCGVVVLLWLKNLDQQPTKC